LHLTFMTRLRARQDGVEIALREGYEFLCAVAPTDGLEAFAMAVRDSSRVCGLVSEMRPQEVQLLTARDEDGEALRQAIEEARAAHPGAAH
jgi:hypothetical protein